MESVEALENEEKGPDWHAVRPLRKIVHRTKGGGVCPKRHPVPDIVASWIGAFLGILAITVPQQFLHLSATTNIMLIGSFGASAVLIYGLPRAALAQPRNLIGGHVVSALAGVSVFKLVGDAHLDVAAGMAVATAIALMHVTRTLHPPGGATALIAVIGGEKTHALGYAYVAAPVFAGAALMLIVALVANNLPSNTRRHYPLYWW